jgi:TolA-binding protein
LRADRAIVLIKRYLGDNPTDPERTAFAYRSLSDQIVWVRQRKPSEIIDQAWIDARHELFQQARKEIVDFVTVNAEKRTWAAEAQLLLVNSFEQEAQLAGSISAERAGGLLVQCAESIFALLNNAPEHPQTVSFPNRIWGLADRIAALGQNEQAIYILRQLSIKLPTHALANQSLVRVAQLYAANLSNPLRAVETYQDYLSRTDGDPAVPAQIFEIARQLATQERYLEAIHVYNVFVDSFPTDQRAASALHAIGKTHQANEAWTEAITTYDRIVEEYAVDAIIPQVRLDVAECRINLGQWSEARRLYEEFLEKFPKNAQFATASERLDVLKKLDRFQDLLADDQIDRNKDDAQYQIARTVLLELKNPVKAIEEFRKVVAKHAKSDVADDAQVEIGRALLALNRLEEGREELLKVAPNYPGSPLADDALFLVAQSFEQFAQQLAGVTQEKAYEESFRYGQKEAYARFNKEVAEESERMTQRRVLLKAGGDEQLIALNDALDASRSGNLVAGKLFCHVTQAELEAETETALHIANRQDRINDAYREAISMYVKAATDHPLGDKTDQSLIRIAEIFETRLKDRPAAMQTYQKVVRQFPGTPVAENAAWKVTQFYVDEGKYAQAADSYKTFIRNYPASPRVADAQFGLAEVLEHLGKWVEAMDAYEIFRQKFNKHPKVRLATDQISWIKTYRK